MRLIELNRYPHIDEKDYLTFVDFNRDVSQSHHENPNLSVLNLSSTQISHNIVS